VKNVPQLLLVNRFTVLKIEDINISDSKPKNAYPSAPVSYPISWRSKWKRRLPKELSTNTLDACRTSLVLAVELSMTNTSRFHFVNALLDCRATGSFIDYNFV